MSNDVNVEEVLDETTQTGEQSQSDKAPIATLLSSISYTSEEDYKNFLENITPDHSVLVLIAAANHSQSKGIFTLGEEELLSKAIKRLTEKPSQSEEPQK